MVLAITNPKPPRPLRPHCKLQGTPDSLFESASYAKKIMGLKIDRTILNVPQFDLMLIGVGGKK